MNLCHILPEWRGWVNMIYVFIHIYILELTWQKNLANIYMRRTEHWTTVSTLLGLISSAHCDLPNWRSNQQPQYAEAETLPLGHRFTPHISDADLTSHGELRDHFDLMCLKGTYSLQRTRPPLGLRLRKSELWVLIT